VASGIADVDLTKRQMFVRPAVLLDTQVPFWQASAMAAVMSLRERQAQQARELILRSVAEQLKVENPENISTEEVARLAGLSKRTLYRYFPSRDELFAAAGEFIFSGLGVDPQVEHADGLIQSFAESTRKFEPHLHLARALLQSPVGRAIRSGRRTLNERYIRAALSEITGQLPPDEERRASALIVHLCSLEPWLRLQDEAGLTPDDARLALVWALETLTADLRERVVAEGQRKARHGE
jgi:AcrR family transcriptional regulator